MSGQGWLGQRDAVVAHLDPRHFGMRAADWVLCLLRGPALHSRERARSRLRGQLQGRAVGAREKPSASRAARVVVVRG